MKLRYSSTSPFVRKAMVVAKELDIEDRLELILTNVWSPDTDITTVNPLRKVPALILDDGYVLYDSPVICEYLDALKPEIHLFPEPGKARWKALHFQALGDGIMDAGVAFFLENRRENENDKSEAWLERYKGTIVNGLNALEHEIDELQGGPLTIGQITVACALGWLEFRFGGIVDVFAGRPALEKWYREFSTRPSMVSTAPKDQ